jgi:cytochrome c oxidase subunit 2
VVHSLSLPQMRIKQDAIPGMIVSVWFVPAEVTGGDRWEISCSQLCGLAHFRMRGSYRSLSPRDFADWTRGQLVQVRAGPR